MEEKEKKELKARQKEQRKRAREEKASTKLHGYELSRNQRQHPVRQSRGGPKKSKEL